MYSISVYGEQMFVILLEEAYVVWVDETEFR